MCAKGMARDPCEPPDPHVLLGSYPSRLPPSLLVGVTSLVVSIFKTMAEHFNASLGPGRPPSSARQTGYYIRAAPGIGKTFTLYETWQWWRTQRLKGIHWGLQDVNAQLEGKGRTAQSLAPATELFCVTFNGPTPPSTTEMSWRVNGATSTFVDLRLIYAELIDPNVRYPVFVDAVWDAIECKELDERDVAAAAKGILKFCRGREAAVPVLLMDELNKVEPLYVNRLPQSVLDLYKSAPAFVRSTTFLRIQEAGGTIVYTSLDKKLMASETLSSGRKMEQACRIGYQLPLSYRAAIEYALAPLTNDPNVSYRCEKLLMRSEDGSVTVAAGFVDAIARLLGGHGRFVSFFVESMRKCTDTMHLQETVRDLTRRKSGAKTISSNIMTDLVAEKIVGAAIEKAGTSCGLRPLFTTLPDGLDAATMVIANVLLGRKVEPSALVPVETGNVPGLARASWDALAGDGIISLPNSQSSKVLVVAWSLLCLRESLFGHADPFYSSLCRLLRFEGDRLTGTWRETFHANWEVVISHARSKFKEYYSCITIKSLLCSSSPDAYVGSSYLINDVKVDASHARTMGVRSGVLQEVLLSDEVAPDDLFEAAYRLSTRESTPAPAADVATFYPVAEDFVIPGTTTILKKDTVVLVISQDKNTSSDATVLASTDDVRDNLQLMEDLLGPCWPSWEHRVVYLLVDRRLGQLFSSKCQSSVAFRASDKGKVCVLLTGDDLPGLFSSPLHDVLCASEYLQSGAVSDVRSFTQPLSKDEDEE